jgi:thioredoxin
MEVNEAEFNSKIKSGERFAADFFATWCAPCRSFAAIFADAGKKSNISFVKVDVDKCGNIADKYHINTVPTVIVFEKGEVVKTHIGGFMSVNELLKFVL